MQFKEKDSVKEGVNKVNKGVPQEANTKKKHSKKVQDGRKEPNRDGEETKVKHKPKNFSALSRQQVKG